MNRDHAEPSDDPGADATRERRVGLLRCRTPEWMRRTVGSLRRPRARWARIPAGALLPEDIKALQRSSDRVVAWVTRRRPRWMCLDAPGVPSRNQTR